MAFQMLFTPAHSAHTKCSVISAMDQDSGRGLKKYCDGFNPLHALMNDSRAAATFLISSTNDIYCFFLTGDTVPAGRQGIEKVLNKI
jgi:hypothetical protein